MPKIKFLPHKDLCPNGLEIEAKEGESICDIALKNNIEIEHGLVQKMFIAF